LFGSLNKPGLSDGNLFLFGFEVAPLEDPAGTLFLSASGVVSFLGGLIAC
jgi:hypothetical protein